MRVLHVLHTSLPFACGYSFRSERIVRHQQLAGVEVAVVTSAQQPSGANVEEVREGIRFSRTNPPRLLRSPIRELQLMRALRMKLDEVCKTFRPDIIHAHSPVLVGLPSIKVAKKARIPFVYEIRDLWENASVDQGKFRLGSMPYRAVRHAENGLVRRADAVFTIGEVLRQELTGRVNRRIDIAANGVDLESFEPVAPRDEWTKMWNPGGLPTVSYVGSFHGYEGLETLVRAVAHLKEAGKALNAVIAGDGPGKGALESLARELGVADIVRFPGRVDHHRVQEIYAVSTVLAYPRIDTLTTRLTTPLKPLEAMAMGKPVIGSDLPAMRELIRDGETGLLFPPGDSARLAQCIGAVIDDDRLAARIAGAGRDYVLKERSWSASLAGYIPVYKSLLA